MSIRVLHVIDHLGFGGAPMVVKNIVERLDSDRFETIVCALRTNPKALPINAELVNLKFGKCNPFAFLRIAKLCREYRIDIIHAHLQKSVLSSLLAGFLCGARIIIHEHGPIFRGGTGCVYRLLLKLLGSKADAAIANSQATKAALIETAGRDEKSVYVVGNFIDLARFDPSLYDRDIVRQSLSIPGDRIVVGFLGRLDVCKGIDLLIEAAAVLCAEDQRYHFVIVGEGSQRQQLESMVRRLGLGERVTFTGLREKPEEIMAAFDVAAIPSRREAFGISAVELMRMRVPVIASPVGGLAEIVQHEKTGLLLPRLDAASLAKAVRRLVRQDDLRQKVVQNAHDYAGRFGGVEQIKAIERIYALVSEPK
jgi:glycosyltransferase involved in cell wall biosynthesis